MFTGIISDIGTITSHDNAGGDLTLTIQTSYDSDGIKLGESIACNGCCLTVVNRGRTSEGDYFTVQLSDETIRCTADQWGEGAKLNLERALKMGDDLSGHLVTGHVDGIATVLNVEQETRTACPSSLEPRPMCEPGGKHGDNQTTSHTLTFEAPADLSKFIAPKGSVTLNGVSLTVNAVDGHQFTINIIPHTWEQTNLSSLTAGGQVNVEIDLLAPYVARLMENNPPA